MEKTEKVMENHGIFCNLKSVNPVHKKNNQCNIFFRVELNVEFTREKLNLS